MPGRRRLWWAVATVVAALVVGRWLAVFAAERLWEGRVSEAAALVGTRFSFLSAGLEVVGLATAVAWFVGNFVWVTRAVLLRVADAPRPAGGWTPRHVTLLAVGAGVVLGVAIGGGTGSWLPAVLLGINGVHFGLTDSLLGADLGVYAGSLPLWELLYDRSLALVLPALAAVGVASILGGNVRVTDRRLWVSPTARWHLGFLLIAGALLIGWSAALVPYRLAAARSGSMGPAEFLLRATVAQLTVLFAATAAVLTFLWMVRFRFVVALAGWVGLSLAVLGGAILVASRATDAPLGADALAAIRRVDSGAYRIRLTTGPAVEGPAALWDRQAVARIATSDSAKVLDVVPGSVRVAGTWTRVWMAIRALPNGDPAVVAVADDRVGPTGGVTSLRWGDETFTPGLLPYLTLSRHHARPGAPEFDLEPAAAGVALSSVARRVALAWALQNGDVLRAEPTQRIAWRLDPVDRLTAVAPFAEWTKPRAVAVDRDVYWIADGVVTVDLFPGSATTSWRGRDVGFLGAGIVGVVRARGAEVQLFLRPDADSLSAAWARIAGPLVEPASALPPALAEHLGVPAVVAPVQTHLLQGAAWLGRAVARQGRPTFEEEVLRAGTLADPLRVPFIADDGQRVAGLWVAPADSAGTARFVTVDTALATSGPHDLQQRWDRFPFYQQLKDSVRAAGSDYLQGAIRYSVRGDTVVAYQPSYALGPNGRGGLVLVNVALGPRLGAGRTLEEAWLNLRGETAPSPVGTDVTTRLNQARAWLDRAEEALKRGDLEGFGRAFSYLRELLRVTGGAPQGAPPK